MHACDGTRVGLPGSDACKVCEGIHDSLRIEFSRLALSGPRTYGELLMLKERLSPYAADEELRRAAETVRPFFASLDGHPACRDDRRQVLRPTGRCSPKASATASTAAMT